MSERLDVTNLGPMDIPRTSEEITSDDVPDPKGYRVCGDYLLVRPVKTNSEKIGSIFIPDATRSDIKYLHNVGRILDFGPQAYRKSDGSVVEWVKGGLQVGDIIQWERFVGKRIRYKGVNLVLLKDTAVQGVVDNAEDLDANVSIED